MKHLQLFWVVLFSAIFFQRGECCGWADGVRFDRKVVLFTLSRVSCRHQLIASHRRIVTHVVSRETKYFGVWVRMVAFTHFCLRSIYS